MNCVARFIADRLIAWAQNRKPDFIIGGKDNPYVKRHWLLPRNPLFNAYVHQFLRSDDDRAKHDHPWLFNISWLMRNRYREWLPGWRLRPGSHHEGRWERDPYFASIFKDREEGSWNFRRGRAPHRVELTDGPVWTLFITGPRWREWGFYCPNKGWIPWQQFCDADDKGSVGRGCD